MSASRLFVFVFDKGTVTTLADRPGFAKQLTALGITKDDLVENHVVGRAGYTLAPATKGFDVSWLSVVAVPDPGPRTSDDLAAVARGIVGSQVLITADGFSHTTRIRVLTGVQSPRATTDLGHLGSVTVGAPAANTRAATPSTTGTLRPISPAPKNFIDDFLDHRLKLTDARSNSALTVVAPHASPSSGRCTRRRWPGMSRRCGIWGTCAVDTGSVSRRASGTDGPPTAVMRSRCRALAN